MGRSLPTLSGPPQQLNMYKLVIVSLLAAATSLPIEDTADVAAAKAEFNAAFAAAAGGLAAKQEPAPVHEIPAPAPLAAPVVAAGIPYGVSALTAVGGYPYAALPAALPHLGLPYAGLPYAGLPLVPAPAKEE